ncbi:MAG TPA: MFS transporter [Acidimicrobiales bacterium]|nr:MFS transporter [Acidimicrobiales bacterium]
MSRDDGTIEPATLGSTPSSADNDEQPVSANVPSTPTVSSWPMWLIGFVIMSDQIDQNIVRGVITPLQEDFGITDAQVGLLLSAFVLVNGLITVPAGYLADRWNRTRTIGHTVMAWSGITALTAAAPNYASLVAVRSALGFGQAVTEPAAASLLADYYPAHRRGRAFSIQQCLVFVGFGLGIGFGGLVGNTIGWRWAFLIVGSPSIVFGLLMYRLKEPARGHGERLHLGLHDHQPEAELRTPLFEHGIGTFLREMAEGLRQDLRTIWGITTMRYALVGISTLLFTITAVGAALPQFYTRQLGVQEGQAEAYLGALVILGGLPGVLLGGRFADRYANRIAGARMAIPAYCILVGISFFTASWLVRSFPVAYGLQLVGFFITVMSVPALRAGLADAVPANLRGAGFGAFNLASVLFGQAAAPLVVFGLSGLFDDNLRTAFLVVTPPVYIGALILLRARHHLEADAARIFQAIVEAVQAQQAREQETAEPIEPA